MIQKLKSLYDAGYNKDQAMQMYLHEQDMLQKSVYSGAVRSQSSASLFGAKTQRMLAYKNMSQWLGPIIGITLMIFFLIGPGTSAILQIIGAMDWFYWVIAIFVLIIVWRSRR